MNKELFRWHHYEPTIILWCIRWYLQTALTYRQLQRMLAEQGLPIVHTTIMRWVHHFGLELNQKLKLHLKTTLPSWHCDETYLKIQGQWKYLYRALDSDGNTLDLNIRDSDGTLILIPQMQNNITDGTVLTIQEVKDKNKPYLIIDLSVGLESEIIAEWLISNNIKVLNIAGPRESQCPGIYERSAKFLENTLPLCINITLDLIKKKSNERKLHL